MDRLDVCCGSTVVKCQHETLLLLLLLLRDADEGDDSADICSTDAASVMLCRGEITVNPSAN